MSQAISSDILGQLDGLELARSDPLDTTEVRWFATGALPPSFVEWFTDAGRKGIIETRSDSYRVDRSPDIGLKQRDHGPLEVKLRRRSSGVLRLEGGVSGRIEEWRKVGVVEQSLAGAGGSRQWSEVHKVVLTRTFGLDPAGSVAEVDQRDLASAGCDIELAAVTVGDTVAWTFAFEAWGPDDRRRDILDDALGAFVRQSSPFPPGFLSELGPDIGYPEWLASAVWGSGVE